MTIKLNIIDDRKDDDDQVITCLCPKCSVDPRRDGNYIHTIRPEKGNEDGEDGLKKALYAGDALNYQ